MEERDDDWAKLLEQHELLQTASMVALQALLRAYRPTAEGGMQVDLEALRHYQNASALRIAAEAALVRYLQGKSKPR